MKRVPVCDDVKIIRASEKDISVIIKLIGDLYLEEERFYARGLNAHKKILKNKNSFLKKDLTKKLQEKNCIIYLAKIRNEFAGIAVASCLKKTTIFTNKKIGFLEDIFVCKKYRGAGVSRLLYDKIGKWFRKNKCEIEKLLVLSKNPAAHIYEKWGFSPVILEMRKPIK